MTQDADLEALVAGRLRALRVARGWTLDELERRTHLSSSTLSRLETGQRRLTLAQIDVLARAYGTSVDQLLSNEQPEDVVLRPAANSSGDLTFWHLTAPDDTSGRHVVKMRLPERTQLPEPRVHPGSDWFYVLSGTLRLQLGGREILVQAGQAASFNTMTPHSLGGHGGPVELLSIFDRDGEHAHLGD